MRGGKSVVLCEVMYRGRLCTDQVLWGCSYGSMLGGLGVLVNQQERSKQTDLRVTAVNLFVGPEIKNRDRASKAKQAAKL